MGFAYEQHLSAIKTGDLIAYSEIGLLPSLTMMFNDAPVSGIGMVVNIPNKWSKIPELFIVEYTRNTEKHVDALTGNTDPGIKLFRFIERLYQVNATSIFWCPLKSPLAPPVEEKLVKFVLQKHSEDTQHA